MSRATSLVVLTLVAATLHAHPAAAQAAGGVKGGLAFSSFLFTSNDGETQALTYRPDFVLGAFVFAPATSTVSLQVEGAYSRLGARLESGTSRVDFELSYFDVSGLIRAAARGQSATVYLLGGVTSGFKIRAETVDSESGSVVSRDDVSEGINSVDFRLDVGGGVEVGHLVIEGRYTHGLRQIAAHPEMLSPEAQSLRNHAFELLAGVRF
jgi:hypothetical protein